MREAAFWQRIKRLNKTGELRGYWRRVEAKLPAGFPDTVVQSDARTFFIELKSVEVVRELKYEVRPEQAVWNHEWNAYGGHAMVLAWVDSEKRMAWFHDAVAIRKGMFHEVSAPECLLPRCKLGAI